MPKRAPKVTLAIIGIRCRNVRKSFPRPAKLDIQEPKVLAFDAPAFDVLAAKKRHEQLHWHPYIPG